MWGFLRILHATAHLTLTVSPAMVDELVANRAVDDRKQIQVWKKGVDSDTFHPRFRSAAMRARLTGGKPERPVLVYVGQLGFEKNLFFLRELLNRNPGVCLAFVGDGPARSELQAAFKGTPTVFLGMLHVRRRGGRRGGHWESGLAVRGVVWRGKGLPLLLGRAVCVGGGRGEGAQ
ncbi:hypothetical protein GPECTOR_3g376 [Gonium pectorale]|uniref:Glycosyl transferase family 1 domain-containing protein n=1 Tax=Gonium pectorale TaxID=33097 RepID=A0A150GZI8_GONPE|nr:hypothetical protein GPECTOR_3g376 [Gonium pectorale]|eukprot:KXZ55235.1 hypothetical protein GPECTOR_3g376 [Gonium pectorale]